MVSIAVKGNALLVQWIHRYLCSPNIWVSLMTYWFFDRFGIDPLGAFSAPLPFLSARLPPFYAAVLDAWKALDGSVSTNGLVVRSVRDSIQLPASSFSCKSCYQLCLLVHPCRPHCVIKFRPSFGDLDWPSTWKSLFYMPLDRQVIDLNWKVAHGVLYTAERLSSFGYNLPTNCFCGYHMESSEHLFFSCPLIQSGINFIQSLLFQASPLGPPITVKHMLFGFSSDELLCVPRVFSYLLNLCKFLVWCQQNDHRFRSVTPSALKLLACLKSRASFYLPLFFKCFVSQRRCRYFHRQWGANGIVGLVTNGSFNLNF